MTLKALMLVVPYLSPCIEMDVTVPPVLPAQTLLLVLSLLVLPSAYADYLPRPAELEPEVQFWTRVFAEIPSDQALVHDNRYLNVVYEVAQIPPNASWSRQRRLSETVRNKYRKVLLEIADGDRSRLNAEQQRVLALWPETVSNDELRQASRRVRFQGGLSDRFVKGLIRSGNWRDYIQQQLSSQSVPEQLVALPHVESSFNPKAGSSIGAKGLWQFTRLTGRRFMQIDHVIDERRDPFVSSDAAAQLLSYNHSILDSWPLAITAYNHGVAGMRRAVRQLGTDEIEAVVHNYSGKRFGFASRNFYVAFLAASAIDSNYSQHFGDLKLDPPANDLVVRLPAYVELDTLSRSFGISESALRQYNPALMPSVIEGNKYVPKGYRLRLPYQQDLNPNAIFSGIPAQDLYAAQTPDLFHKVGRGDSLSVIAVRYKTSVRELVALNNLDSSHLIKVGQVLRLPYTNQQGTIVLDEYVVKSGDTLSEIAMRAGTTRSHLVRLNKLGDGNRIYVGQKLLIQQKLPQEEALAPVNTNANQIVAKKIESAMSEPETEALSLPDMAPAEIDIDAATVSIVDPSNYDVAPDGTVMVHSMETIGHYANWLGVSTQSLRNLNGYKYGQPLVIGQRIRLGFSKVSVIEFTSRRVQFHKELQEAFFMQYRIVDMQQHKLRDGESIWLINRKSFNVPEWLLRQYNPDLDFNRVRQGTVILFPKIERIDVDA
ncbi:MAG: LysM peptidoglycan-binding domain-containing protein [Gammaproteobacteria bacterium]|nr:LysM peptidoglycan-binding domain-containing protein [Gammaproteobacteria bacterium]